MKRKTTGVSLFFVICVAVLTTGVVGQDQLAKAEAAKGKLPVGQCPFEFLESYGPLLIYSSCDCVGGDCNLANGLMAFDDVAEEGCKADGNCKHEFGPAAAVRFEELKLSQIGNCKVMQIKWTGEPPKLAKGVDLETPLRNFYVNSNDQVIRSRYTEQYFKHFNDAHGKAIGYKQHRGVLRANVDGEDIYFMAVRSYTENFPVKLDNKAQRVRLKFYVALQLAEKPGVKDNLTIIQAEYANGQLKIVDENCEINGASFNTAMVAKTDK